MSKPDKDIIGKENYGPIPFMNIDTNTQPPVSEPNADKFEKKASHTMTNWDLSQECKVV